jgi:hypothetical protein
VLHFQFKTENKNGKSDKKEAFNNDKTKNNLKSITPFDIRLTRMNRI